MAADGNSSERSTAQQPGVRALWVGEKYIGEDDLTLHVGKNLATASLVQICWRAYRDHVRPMDPSLFACMPAGTQASNLCFPSQICPVEFTLQAAEVQGEESMPARLRLRLVALSGSSRMLPIRCIAARAFAKATKHMFMVPKPIVNPQMIVYLEC